VPINRMLLTLLLVIMSACSEPEQAGRASSPAPTGVETAPSGDAEPNGQAIQSVASLNARYADTGLRVLDVSEREWKGRNMLAVTLSVPLDTEQDLQPFFSVNTDNGRVVDGAWVTSDDKKMAYFTATQPKTQYEVSVHRGLPGLTGATLELSTSQKIKTRNINPSVSFASKGSVLPAGLSSGIPVSVINVKEVDIHFHRINPQKMNLYFSSIQNSYHHRFRGFSQLSSWGELVYSGRFVLDPPANTLTTQSIDVEGIDELAQPGLYVAVMEIPGSYDYQQSSTHFVVTDIGLQARDYGNELWIMASSLTTAKPIKGLTVQLLDDKGNVIQERKTSPQGDVQFTAKNKEARLLVAHNNKHTAVLELTGPALDLSEFDLGKRPQLPQEAFVYTPRDLYRPGETVDFNILLRDGDGRLTQKQNLNVRIHTPDGQVVQQAILVSQDLGFYQYQFTLPGNSATGNWTFDISNLASGVVHHRFKVEEFLPERLVLQFNQGKQTPLVFNSQEAVRIPLNGMYLYGAPAAGNRLSNRVQIGLLRQPMDKYKGFLFGNELDNINDKKFELADQFLDDEGNVIVDIGRRWEKAKSPLQVQLISSLYESGGRPVVRSYRAQVWPKEPMLGVRPSFGEKNPDANSEVTFDVIRVDSSGKQLPSGQVQANLVREDRQYFWSYDDNNGWHYEYTEKEYVVAAKNIDLRANENNQVQFNVDWGRYRLVVTDPVTKMVTSVRFQAGADWYSRWQENQQSDRSMRPDAVTLALDKEAYKAGETAKLSINSPHAGDAIIMVESDQPLWIKRVTLKETQTSIDIPIDAAWNQHNLYISAVVLRGASRKQQITPNRAFGLLHLRLDRSPRALQVRIDAPDKTRPDAMLESQVVVTDASGKPFANGYVTLAAVDVGVLNISDFTTPDPFHGFFGRRRYAVDSRDLYGKVIELNEFDKARIRFGGDADLSRGGKEAQADVQIVSLFNGPVKLDQQGRAQVNFPLPYFNGKLRLMALAFGAAQFGSSEQETTIAAPLVTQLSLPRFLALDDQAQGALDLHNLSGQDQQLTVEIETGAGLTPATQTRTIQLQQDRKTTLTFALHSAAVEPGKVRIHVTGAGFRAIDREWQLNIRPGYAAESRSQKAVLSESETASLGAELMAGIHPSSAEMIMSLGNKADLGLPSQIQGLLRYPYGCLEQTTSASYPYAYASERIQQRYNMKKVSELARKKRMDQAFTRIAGMQLSNGGFGLWSDDSPEQHWLTAYVADFMLVAEKQGYSVPKSLRDATFKRLKGYIQSGNGLFENRYSEDIDHYRFAYKAYAAYVLAKDNQASLSSIRILHDRYRKNSASGLPLLQLGIALQLTGDKARAEVAINEALLKQRLPNQYLGDYGSVIRDQAWIIYLLMEQGIHKDYALELSYSLADEIKAQRWLSTQERNALFMAGLQLEDSLVDAWSAKVTMNGDSETMKESANVYRQWQDGNFPLPIEIHNTGKGPIRGSVVVSGYPTEKPEPLENGYQIERQYFNDEGQPIEFDQVRSGDLVLVHLSVKSDVRAQDSLVIDLIPAGFELENQNLKHATKLSQFEVDGKTLETLLSNSKIQHQEYRDDRYVAAVELWGAPYHLFYMMRAVTPGEYRIPPPYVEDMYRAERRGLGDSPERVKVLPR